MTLQLGKAVTSSFQHICQGIRKGDKQLCTWSKYAVMGKDGVMECKNQARFLYADDVCLMASSEDDMKVIMEQVKECVIEYGLKVNEKMSKVACIHGEVGRRRWMMGDCCIGEVEEYKYLEVTV